MERERERVCESSVSASRIMKIHILKCYPRQISEKPNARSWSVAICSCSSVAGEPPQPEDTSANVAPECTHAGGDVNERVGA